MDNEIIKILAKNNKLSNIDMFKILRNTEQNLLLKNIDVYFKSIIGILNHMISSNIIWLQRIRQNFNNYKSLNNNILDIKEISAYQEILIIENQIITLDDIFITLINNDIQINDFETEIKYTNTKNELIRKKLKIIIVHIFNHLTHHRGEISACLEILKIKNNFSNLASRF